MADRIRPMVAADLEAVLAWRNHADVRCFMHNQHEISLDEHRGWFMRCADDSTRALLIVEGDGGPLGFVQFSGLRRKGVADWGFFAAPGSARGTGRRLGRAALDHGFGMLGLHKICGQVLGFNTASLRMHQALGFREEGRLREHSLIDDTHHDLVCFGLLAREWSGHPYQGDNQCPR